MSTRMACRDGVQFEEAVKKRGTILAWTGVTIAAVGWLLRGHTTGLGLLGALALYLMTGDRYQWVYIWRKTVYRDMLGLRVLVPMMIRVWLWEKQGKTVVNIWEENALKFGDKKAIIMGDRHLTFRQGSVPPKEKQNPYKITLFSVSDACLSVPPRVPEQNGFAFVQEHAEGDEFSNRVAWYFKRQGFRRGEVIGLYMDTQPDYVFVWLGLAKLGVITALVNSNLRGAQLLHCVKVASCKALIYGDELSAAVTEIRKELEGIPLFQYNSPDRSTADILSDSVPLATELREMPLVRISDKLPNKSRDTLLYIYTSGTTGLPKAAIITNIRYLLIPAGLHASARLRSSDVVYDPLPLHHTAGGVLGVGLALVHGCTVVLRQKFSASNYWKDVTNYGCTVTQYIGEICRYLLAVPPGLYDQSHKVRVIIGNGLRPQIWEQFVQRFNIKRVVEFYGATEGNSNLVNLDSKVGAIGFLSRLVSSVYPLMLVKCDEITGEIFRDDKGRCIPCGPFEPGLLLGKIDKRKAILTFAGYADKTSSEKKMLRNVKSEGDCYFNTGDVFIMDHFGYFYFKDRTGDTFRWRGENVSTAEVEGVISTLVGLQDAIVFGVAVPNVEGKAGMAAIADPDKKLDISSLAKGLRTSLPAYARPLFLRILPETPLTSTFKLKKRELMEQGFNPQNHKDDLYFLDQKTGEYVPLTQKLFDDITTGVIRL